MQLCNSKGISQGCGLSPYLFNGTVNDILEYLDTDRKYSTVINGLRILGLLFADNLAIASFTIFMWSECSVRYELNDRQETRRPKFFLLLITLDVDIVQCFGGILRLDEQKTFEMGFLKKLKFWKKHNVTKY